VPTHVAMVTMSVSTVTEGDTQEVTLLRPALDSRLAKGLARESY
jgi:hypothetical protein